MSLCNKIQKHIRNVTIIFLQEIHCHTYSSRTFRCKCQQTVQNHDWHAATISDRCQSKAHVTSLLLLLLFFRRPAQLPAADSKHYMFISGGNKRLNTQTQRGKEGCRVMWQMKEKGKKQTNPTSLLFQNLAKFKRFARHAHHMEDCCFEPWWNLYVKETSVEAVVVEATDLKQEFKSSERSV